LINYETAVKKNIEIAGIKKALAKHQKLPKLDAKASYSLNSLGDNFSDAINDTYISDDESWEIGLEFEWPWGGEKGCSPAS